ncbi:MAG: dTDP-4-dehydrorhamnose reductase [Bacteroidetes bacterium]|nr:dTDP-4-dehydrorhamnose reductase [Bacteroidota bacterium]
MKILVTGGDGQLGSSLKKLAGDYPEYVFKFIDLKDLDLTDFPKVYSFIEAFRPEILVNCAAYTAVDKAESDPDAAMSVNADVPGDLAKICRETGTRLIHLSTDYVFDGKSYRPYLETDPVNPDSVYARTKLEGENRILEQSVSGIIIRTAWLYSEYGQNFVKTIRKKGEELGKLRVVYDQTGSPTYAGDLARAILEILPEVINFQTMELFHYTNEGVISWYDFAKAILELSGISCTVEPVGTRAYPTPATRPPYSVLDKTKIKERFDISIPYWKDSLKECIANLNASR